MTVAAFLLFLLVVGAGLCGGLGLARWQHARHSALLNDAIRAGVGRLYARDMPDGRSVDRLPTGRYGAGE